jgi:hypothetical protein
MARGQIPINKGKNQKTGIDYEEIKEIYITGNFTLNELAEQFGVSVEALQVHSAKEKWKNQKKQYKQKYHTEIQEKLKGEIIENEIQINRKHYFVWNQLLDIVQEMIKNKDTELKYENGKYNANKIYQITDILVKTQGGQRLAAGLIEAAKARELEMNEKRLAFQENKLNTDINVPQQSEFIAAINNQVDKVWNSGNDG